MNSLLNYGSDDDYDDSSEEKQTDWRGSSTSKGSAPRQTDTDYEEVQMDLSEGSNDSKPENKEPISRRSRERDSRDRREQRESRERDSRGRYDRRDKEKSSSRTDRRDRDRDRKSRRSPSRERRRSRSPRRSRSRSRERSRKYSKRYERTAKSAQTEKSEPQKSGDANEPRANQSEGDRFFMPGITGRFRDQIERRKQLWQKKDPETETSKTNGQSKKVWETTTFAQDTDGKVANKFKRLMGIKNQTEASGQSVDVLKKQEEMFSSMEQQYEVARTATHTMRGVGLGFGSYQR